MTMYLDLINHVAPWAFGAVLICAAWCDARSFIIPDRLSVLAALLYPVYALSGGTASDMLGALIVAVIMLLVASGLFAADLMGGGDVKLMSAVALWAGPHLILPFLLVTALAGGVLSALALLRLRRPALAGNRAPASHRRVPYGVAIAAGGISVAIALIGA